MASAHILLWPGVGYGYGTGAEPTTEDKLADLVRQMDSLIERVKSAAGESDKTQTEILPGFPDKISGTYRDDITKDEVQKGPDSMTWTEKVGELPATVQDIIVAGGLKVRTKEPRMMSVPLGVGGCHTFLEGSRDFAKYRHG
ncbi:hypothetical protein F5X99DRAFT_415057 [Biscogniauxia marginata]|nr:hypothetical protein F5X99DRAFT_415057 [Biscogniauxia marginata]